MKYLITNITLIEDIDPDFPQALIAIEGRPEEIIRNFIMGTRFNAYIRGKKNHAIDLKFLASQLFARQVFIKVTGQDIKSL